MSAELYEYVVDSTVRGVLGPRGDTISVAEPARSGNPPIANGGGGARTEGTGSRRRTAEFVVRPDDFKHLRTGEAVVWTTLGPPPEMCSRPPARRSP